jgi:uncharacterized protein (DUF885 family)
VPCRRSVSRRPGRPQPALPSPDRSLIIDTTKYEAPLVAPSNPDEELLDGLIRERFTAVMRRAPIFATFLGVSEHDGELSDGSAEAILADIGAAREFAARLEAIAPATLAPYWQTEREVALLATRRQIFDEDVQRLWERRVNASDEIGDGIFLLLARGARPLRERLEAIAARLEAAPRHMREQRTRLGSRPPVRLWNEMELQTAKALPVLFGEVVAAAESELGAGDELATRLRRGRAAANAALDDYIGWVREQLTRADDDFALGRDAYDELISLRALDGLDADAILEIGEQQLAHNRAARRAVAAEIDPGATEAEVVDRVKSAHPANFGEALAAYRAAMAEARQFVVDHELVTLPEGEDLRVIETPTYLRQVTPFAAYYSAPKFGRGHARQGLYIVTPSIDDDPGAMREHNFASIYNTGIHEAYPGHHVQLAVANRHPSLARLLIDAPEFVEGWAMYCEQLMREEGFGTAPEHRLVMYTDAIWRACRIILDVQLHRGAIGVEEATEMLVEQTGFERPNAAAEVNRYTYTPTYQLSYLLGKVLLLRLRDDERRRLGGGFDLRHFHDAMLAEGSLPVSLQRRLLAAGGG